MTQETTQCFKCHRKPSEISEYVQLAEELTLDCGLNGISPEEAMIEEEGTYNPLTKTFCCTSCYVAIGCPGNPAGWLAPAAQD